MTNRKPLRIGMVGYGFMGRAHSNAYRRVNNFFDLEYEPVLQAVCARDAGEGQASLPISGATPPSNPIGTSWSSARTSTPIDICVPNNLHHDIAIAAAAAGKMILCEKPLSMNTAEGQEMVDAVEKAGVANTVWYNYRRVPAVTLAKQLDR